MSLGGSGLALTQHISIVMVGSNIMLYFVNFVNDDEANENTKFPDLFVPLDMKGCICHFAKWQIHPFNISPFSIFLISKLYMYINFVTLVELITSSHQKM